MRGDPVTTEGYVVLRGMNVPNTPVLQNVCWYLSGYADGEGCFCVSFSPRAKLRTRLEVRSSFSVGQNKDRSEVLFLYKKVLSCGTIRPNRRDKTIKFEVRNLNDLIFKVIPFFEKYPLKSSKQNEFLKFRKICQLIYLKNNRYESGLKEIVKLAIQMNPGSKRKYNTQQLQSILQLKV